MSGPFVKRTQDSLGRVIKKPPLTEKLLSKPPFRYLHDIFTEVIRTTGFLKGLFTEFEMKSDNVKDKDAKIAFLQKAIDVVMMVSGDPLTVKPARIVAGHEPEKTNELLQTIAKCCLNKLSSDDSVRRVLAGEKIDLKAKALSSSKSQGKENREKKDDERKRQKDKDQEPKVAAEEKPPKQHLEVMKKDSKIDADQEDKVVEIPGAKAESPVRIPRPSSAKGQRRKPKSGVEDESDVEGDLEAAHNSIEKRHAAEVNGEIPDELSSQIVQSKRIARPGSARPAPPKVKKQESADSPSERIGSAKPVSNVIVDKRKNVEEEEDDDEQFVVEEAVSQLPDMPEMEPVTAVELHSSEDHGGLVRKILETKKDYESSKSATKPKDQEKTIISETAKKKERELVAKEIEKLRTSIQTLCRSALPLGKIMDYIQEDMDSMQNELSMWRRENKKHAESLLREQSITDTAVEPLKTELAELEQLIKDQQDKNCAVKAHILKNEDKIQKMISSINFSSRT
ncbi:TRAF3-interacting protein 1 isoform X4 [Heterodontus francisci]|uniref:TRAF3-interacting protein 1 isoform X4 n=1 Tax=Heterodontus francisci TaxID=7792 RepID=UPI00355B269E